jgi:hypothetical protein
MPTPRGRVRENTKPAWKSTKAAPFDAAFYAARVRLRERRGLRSRSASACSRGGKSQSQRLILRYSVRRSKPSILDASVLFPPTASSTRRM